MVLMIKEHFFMNLLACLLIFTTFFNPHNAGWALELRKVRADKAKYPSFYSYESETINPQFNVPSSAKTRC